MNPLEGLAQYLDRLERRLRLFAWTRGAAAVIAAALTLTVAIVGSLILVAFSPASLLLGRFVLFLGIGGAIALALVIPLLRMNRRRAAQEVEQRHPGFDQRLLTFTERSRDNAADPFLPLLAEDALVIARGAAPERVIDTSRFIRFAGLGAAAASVLVCLVFWGPGVFGYGASLLWGSYSKDTPLQPFYSISVQPSSKTIRRHSDQLVSATLSGFTSSHASVWVQWANSSKWEEAPMEPQPSGPGFAFLLVRVPDDAQYYVEAGGIKSATWKLHTVDLPAVKNLRVTYHYPSWAGMAAVTEDPGGDLRAVEGTVAKVEIQTDKPLNNAQIVFENGKPIQLDSSTNNRITTSIPIEKDGTYHIAVMDHGELVRLSDDYFIEARKPGVPTVTIAKPGKDARVSPIEEVGVTVTAADDFPLQAVDLHYSVNGAPEKIVSMLRQKGAKMSEGSLLLSMEDFRLAPGDIVSLYATAQDGKNSAKTDMYFIQAVPFEFEYSQSQAGGGGGGGGDQEQQISEREKEIIAATFNQLKGDARARAAAAENGRYLAEVQAKLRDQAQSLANRTKARQLDGSGAGFQQFVKEMELAVAAMTPASDKLRRLAFGEAMTPEQQALQHLLRAESTFRQIQVQIGKGSGGGAGGGGAGRDLANLFDLELDKDKNQYETNAGSAAEQKQQQVDETLKKLEDLARRQKALADQQRNNPQQLAEQRYQQEMLRREAAQLQRDMQNLQRGDQSQQQQSGQQQNGSRQQQQSGQSRAMNDQLEKAIKDLDQATREMSNASSARQPGQQSQQGRNQAQTDAERAAEVLQRSAETLQSARKQQNGSQVADLANRSLQIAGQQQDFEQRLRRNFGTSQGNQQTARQMADEKQKMMDAFNQLQKDMQQAARDIAATQPGVAKDLRDAMGKSQQAEIGTQMEFTADALRRGLGQYAVMREAPVTRAMNELKDQLKKIEGEAASRQQQGGAPGAGGDKSQDSKTQMAMQQALTHAGQIRREMEALNRSAQGQKGRNGNRQQGGGNSSAGGVSDEPFNATNFGAGLALPPNVTPEQAYSDLMRDIGRLRANVGDDKDLTREYQDLLKRAREMDPRHMNNDPQLGAVIGAQALSEIDELELVLRRKLAAADSSVRSTSPRNIPPGYAAAVAEYTKRLSKQ